MVQFIIGIIMVVIGFVGAYVAKDGWEKMHRKENEPKKEVYNVESHNQQGGITAGKLTIINQDPKLLLVEAPQWNRHNQLYQSQAIFRSSDPNKDVENAEILVEFEGKYKIATYEIVRDNPQMALMIVEMYGIIGAKDSNLCKVGLVKLPARTSLVTTFVSDVPLGIKQIVPSGQ